MEDQTINGGVFNLKIEDDVITIDEPNAAILKEKLYGLASISEAMAAEFLSLPFEGYHDFRAENWPSIYDYLNPKEYAKEKGYKLETRADNIIGLFKSVVDEEAEDYPAFILRDAVTVVYSETQDDQPGGQGLTFTLPSSLPNTIATGDKGVTVASYDTLHVPHYFEEKRLSALIIPEMDIFTYCQVWNTGTEGNKEKRHSLNKWRPPFLLPWPWGWCVEVNGVHFVIDLFEGGSGVSHPAAIPLDEFEIFNAQGIAEFFEGQHVALKQLAETI